MNRLSGWIGMFCKAAIGNHIKMLIQKDTLTARAAPKRLSTPPAPKIVLECLFCLPKLKGEPVQIAAPIQCLLAWVQRGAFTPSGSVLNKSICLSLTLRAMESQEHLPGGALPAGASTRLPGHCPITVSSLSLLDFHSQPTGFLCVLFNFTHHRNKRQS